MYARCANARVLQLDKAQVWHSDVSRKGGGHKTPTPTLPLPLPPFTDASLRLDLLRSTLAHSSPLLACDLSISLSQKAVVRLRYIINHGNQTASDPRCRVTFDPEMLLASPAFSRPKRQGLIRSCTNVDARPQQDGEGQSNDLLASSTRSTSRL
ncbi:RNA12 protein [Pseudozyma hubeiensis SY62]|uniref:RNA12 protein n=1 Tax=Pseudozyma hubeiensis (strain SY62) TaxID=1305764 RepID=R9P5B4_PSEHS|nr:RNA12 protein [Pseudozyma hubeiensis SY62]GAC96623.1 RNA12 protein [Pseudozyma hubeiensis SY62]